jgi:hypothetical protein
VFGRLAVIRERLYTAERDAQAAREALTEAERVRWDKIAAARLAVGRVGRFAGTATSEQAAWLAKVARAIDTPGDARISDAIRRVWVADEAAFWAAEGAAAEERRVFTVLAQVESFCEAVGVDVWEDVPF